MRVKLIYSLLPELWTRYSGEHEVRGGARSFAGAAAELAATVYTTRASERSHMAHPKPLLNTPRAFVPDTTIEVDGFAVLAQSGESR